MKKPMLIISALAACAVIADGIIVSSTSETVTTTVTKSLGGLHIVQDDKTGEYSAVAEYFEYTRKVGPSGTTVVIKPLREVHATWAEVIAIAPAMVQAREQLQAALPTLLANP